VLLEAQPLPPLPPLPHFDFDLVLFATCHLCSVCAALLPLMNEFETCVRPKRARTLKRLFLTHIWFILA